MVLIFPKLTINYSLTLLNSDYQYVYNAPSTAIDEGWLLSADYEVLLVLALNAILSNLPPLTTVKHH